eukprot:4682841-Pyramimonas_sp.AAC.1
MDACYALAEICQMWGKTDVPFSFKKGDATLPSNYRPISLLAVCYKALAAMLHSGLLEAGAEDRMRQARFGFRPKRGAAAALSPIRRM